MEYKQQGIYPEIQRAIYFKYRQNMNLYNKYIYEWEGDITTFSKAGYTTEFEIKLSRSDFFADFKKHRKHRASENPCKLISYPRWKIHEDHHNQIEIIRLECPNRLSYICPTNLIAKAEIPKYAGLIYCTDYGSLTEIIKAPLLHKEKFSNWRYIAEKLYAHQAHDFLHFGV